MSKPRQYRLLAGTHAEGRGKEYKLYKAGEIITSERDLELDFVGKFQRVRRDADDAPAGKPFGEDVTELFQTATGTDMLVFKSGANYNVVDNSDENKSLNKKPLATRKDVIEFLKKMVAKLAAA